MGAGRSILLCVGATKAGTTWAHDQLAAHPECHLRTIKEYHYFSTHNDGQWDKMIADTHSEIAQLAARAPQDRSPYEVQRLGDLQSWLPMILPRAIDPAAFGQYLNQGADMQHPSAKLVGDFTPAYSVISSKLLEPAARLPNLKVVYFLRDPLSRLWSHIRMTVERMAPELFEPHCHSLLRRVLAGDEDGGIRGMLRRGDYAGNLPKLQRIFGDKLLVMFTEDLFTKAGFDRLLAHLGLAPAAPDVQKRVHEGRSLPFPAQLRRPALAFLRPQYDYVAAEFTNLPHIWREAMAEMTRGAMASMPQTVKAQR